MVVTVAYGTHKWGTVPHQRKSSIMASSSKPRQSTTHVAHCTSCGRDVTEPHVEVGALMLSPSLRLLKAKRVQCCLLYSMTQKQTYIEGWAKTVLVKQYRPPIKNVSVEFPAGLIDEGETPDTTAVRELKEETGYTGTVVSVSPVCVADPGLSSANMAVVTVHVDADAEENLKPVQMQDDSTFIEVALVDMAEFFNTLQAWAKEGFLIDANVWCLAYGLHMATNEVKKSM
eukprot:TRINITY_DN1601_c0_g1_i3.p1 TRINITY_DN1601_c0_g1~~TRINITY_DN1601_c0_g1_i3.p1  ORF type:complete len:230 (-),score=29.17 TRINITY_DN1601_c0_g1_i3:27-716(-)